MPTVLITGATAGIGRATALHLADLGHRVIATGRRADALEELKQEGAGHGIETAILDVTDPATVEAAVDRVGALTDGAGLDVLVNNAGFGHGGPMECITDADLRQQFDTNVFGLMSVVRGFLPAMRARGRGRIVNVSSVAGRLVLPFFGAYNASKHAVEALSDALRLELKPHGVDVVLIEPGAINTEFGIKERRAFEHYAATAPAYKPQLDVIVDWHSRLHPNAAGPEAVARSIERAISAPRPRARYVVPAMPNRLFIALRTLLPTSWYDTTVGRITGLHRIAGPPIQQRGD